MMQSPRLRTTDWQKPIGERPEFYLVYLIFYVVPWLFKTPSMADILAFIAALTVFLPIYFHGHKQTNAKSAPHVIAISLIGFAVSPFFGSHGVFHVYAMVQAGFIRPERYAWIMAFITSVIFTVFSWATSQSWWDYGFILILGLITSIGAISTAGRIEKGQRLARTRELEQHIAAENERERIAQDLHDLLGQTLTMVSLKSELAIKLFEQHPEQAKQELEEIRQATRGALKDVREAVAGMTKTTFNSELKRAQQILKSADIRFEVIGALPTLTSHSDQILGLSLREAITNIARHSRASEARLAIDQRADSLQLIIEDNGVAGPIIEGSGLKGLRKRVSNLGGNIQFDLTPGLRISLQIPIRPEGNHD